MNISLHNLSITHRYLLLLVPYKKKITKNTIHGINQKGLGNIMYGINQTALELRKHLVSEYTGVHVFSICN